MSGVMMIVIVIVIVKQLCQRSKEEAVPRRGEHEGGAH